LVDIGFILTHRAKPSRYPPVSGTRAWHSAVMSSSRFVRATIGERGLEVGPDELIGIEARTTSRRAWRTPRACPPRFNGEDVDDPTILLGIAREFGVNSDLAPRRFG